MEQIKKPLLINAQTGKPDVLPDDQIDQAILNKTHYFPKGTQVNVRSAVNPDSMEAGGSFSSDDLYDALSSGEYTIESPDKGAVRQAVEENRNIGGSIKVALGQFADEFGGGLGEIALDATQDPLEVAKRQAIKKDHDFANNAFGTLGFGASLLVPGAPLARLAGLSAKAAPKIVGAAAKALAPRIAAKGATTAAANSAAKQIAQNIARSSATLGVESALFSAPTAITEAALGDPELAAETLLINGLAGSVLGAGGKAAKEIFGLIPKRAIEEGAEKGLLQNFKNERAAKALGFTKGQIKKLEKGQKEAEEIGETLLGLKTSDGKKIIGAFDSPEQLQINVKKAKDEIGERIGQVYKEIDETGFKQFDSVAVQEKVEEKLGKFFKSSLNKDEVRVYNNALEAIKEIGGETGITTLARGRELLDQLDSIAFPGGKPPLTPSAKQTLARDIRKIVRTELDMGAERGAGLLGKKDALKALKSDNALYGKIKKAERAIDDKISSIAGNKLFGLTDTITGVGAAGAAGIPAAAVALGAKRLAERYGNQVLANVDGLLFAEKSMAKVAKKLDELPERLEDMLKGRKLKDVARSTSVGAIQRLLDDEDKRINRAQAFDKLKEQLSEIDANAALPMERSSQISGVLSETGAPETASQLTLKNGLIAKYLSDHMPRPIKPNTPFKQIKWAPSDAELSRFERRVHAIQNPTSIIDELVNGTLSTEAVDAVKTVYPKLFQNIQGRVMQHFMDNPQTVSYNNRIKLSFLLDMPLDDDLKPENIRAFQKNFAEIDEAAAEGQNTGTKPFNVPDMQTNLQSVALS
jgi:hypothetical protein